MRFCLVTTFYPPYSFGGDAVFVRRLARSLTVRGHEVHVVHCRDAYRLLAGEPDGPTPADDGVVVHGLDSVAGPLSPVVTQLTGRPGLKARPLRRILEATAFDVVHFHNISLVGGPGVLAYGSGVKLYTVHEHWLVCPMHAFFRHGREPCFERECLRCQLRGRRPPQLWRSSNLVEESLRHVDAFIAPSRAAARRHRAEGLDLDFVHIPYFLPDPLEGRPEPGTAERSLPPDPFLLFVGRLERLKGAHTLVPLVRDHSHLRLVVTGDGTDEAFLREMAGGCSRIHFTGHLPMEELAPLYSRATAVVLPSLAFEVLPLVLLEASAFGTPCIVRDLGAPSEIVAETGSGLVYSSDPELVEAAEFLTEDPEERGRLGEAARRTYETRWTEERHMEAYMDLVERYANGSQATPSTSDGTAELGGTSPIGSAGGSPSARRAPRRWPLVGHLPRFLADKLAFLERCAEDPREVVPLRLPGPTRLLKHPSDVRYVLEEEPSAFEKSAHFTAPEGRSVMGEGLHTATSKAHRALRREMQPLFSARAVAQHTDAILAAADRRLDGWTGQVDLKEEMFEMTLDALGRILFGREWQPVLRDALVARRRFIHAWTLGRVPGLRRLPLPLSIRHRRAERLLRRTVARTVARRRAGESEARGDMLTALATMEGRDGRTLPVRRIEDEVLTLGTTGFETLAVALTWALHLLGGHPEERRRLDDEVARVCGDRPPTPEDLGRLEHTARVVQESLRLYPPTWILVRIATRPLVLPTGAPVPEGGKIYICPWILGRQERFFPDPERFDPDRFSPDRSSESPRLAHVPFGAGPRICIGRPLALRESVMLLARVSQRVRFSLEDPEPPRPKPGVVLEPAGPVVARARPRNSHQVPPPGIEPGTY